MTQSVTAQRSGSAVLLEIQMVLRLMEFPLKGDLDGEKVLMLKAAQSTPRLLVLFSPDPFPVLVQHHVTVA